MKTGGDKELDFFTSILVSEGLLGLSPEDLLQSLKVIHRSKSNLYSFQDSFEFFLRHLLGHRLKKLKLSEEKQIKLKEQIELALEALEINGELRQQNGDGERNTESAEEANYDSFEDY